MGVAGEELDNHWGYDPSDDENECLCGGDGWIVDDCFEDTCCCAEPELEHDLIPCPQCRREVA